MRVLIVAVMLIMATVAPFVAYAQSPGTTGSQSISVSAQPATTNTALWNVDAPLTAAQKAQIASSGINLTPSQLAQIKAISAKKAAESAAASSNSVEGHAKASMAAGNVPTINGPATIHLNNGVNGKTPSANSLLTEPSSAQTMNSQVWDEWENDHAFSGAPAGGGSGMGDCSQEWDNGYLRQSNALAGLAWGTNDAWAWQGTTFVWNGPTGNYNMDFHGTCFGMTEVDSFVSGIARSTSTIDACIKDDTVGSDPQTTDIYSVSEGSPFGVTWTNSDQQTLGKTMNVNLVNGHQYTAYMNLDGNVEVYGIADAVSDFWGYNGHQGYMEFDYVHIW